MTNIETHATQSADEQLANLIAKAIGEAQLVSEDRLPKIKSGLQTGSLSSTDWKLLIELGELKKPAGGAK